MGLSNSAKTELVEIIKSAFKEWRIGHINGPSRNKLIDFWLQEAWACDVKIMEELEIPNEQVVQHFKELLESNPSLLANIK